MEEELQESRLEALHEEMAETEVQYTLPHQRTKTPLLSINTKKVLKQNLDLSVCHTVDKVGPKTNMEHTVRTSN